MSNWCKNRIKKEEKLSIREQFLNWFSDNLFTIIETFVWTIISIGALVYARTLTEDYQLQLVKCMCFVGFMSVSVNSKREKDEKNYSRYLPYILAIIWIRCM